MTDTVIDDYARETARPEDILARLTAEQWLAESGAAGVRGADALRVLRTYA